MKCHLTLPACLFAGLLTVALATGSVLFFMLSVLVLLCAIAGAVSVIWASSTLTVSAELSDRTVRRGDEARLRLSARHRGWLPIAPVLLRVSSPAAARREIRLRDMPGRLQTLTMPIHAAHVGVFSTGVEDCTVEDLLGLFSRTSALPDARFDLAVLPRTFDVEPLTLSPGDPGSEIMARATEDLSAPSDVRTYQPGRKTRANTCFNRKIVFIRDAMKKIHWKLSLRKGELMVRRFDEPVLQDVLILMDCSRPPSWGHPKAAADLRDALLETAASVFAAQLATDHAVRMPLSGSHPVDVEKSMGAAIAIENLARTDFSESDRFERVLALESRRMRKVGCAVIIAARLTGAMVDIMIRMRRMGPTLRLYLVTFAPEDANVAPLRARLERAGIEVTCILPEAAGKAGAVSG